MVAVLKEVLNRTGVKPEVGGWVVLGAILLCCRFGKTARLLSPAPGGLRLLLKQLIQACRLAHRTPPPLACEPPINAHVL